MSEYFDELDTQEPRLRTRAQFAALARQLQQAVTDCPGLAKHIIEIVKPGTGEPVGVNEVGEILVTRMHPDYPLVRFATGDRSAFIEEQSPCGRTAKRIKGWLGRADPRTKVRGMLVDPAQIQLIRKEQPNVSAVRLLVSRANN